MKPALPYIFVLVIHFFVIAPSQAQSTDWSISANSVAALRHDISSVSPAVLTPANAEDYLSNISALGYEGPLGPYGPLGSLGPIGGNVWNTSYWISAIGDWSEWAEDNTSGPLSELGPLGPYGPLSELAYDIDLPAINDFGKQLQGGGLWTALGPIGPLGALGPLGPLGPVGAHGYTTDLDGRYINELSEEVRQVDVPYGEDTRTYDLVEIYPEDYAETMSDNDTSFMVEGYVAWPYGETDSFEFTITDQNYVTIVLSPIYALDDFDLTITDENGDVVAYSNTVSYVDFIQLNDIPTGTTLAAEVELYSSFHTLTKDYRLFVTGSTQHISTQTPITGDHQLAR